MPMNNRIMVPRQSFSPLKVPGLGLWLDSDESTFTLNGSGISEWRDKSGNARHFEQGTALNQPTWAGMTIGPRAAVTIGGHMTGNAAARAMLRNVSGATVVSVMSSSSPTFRIFLIWSTGTGATSGRIAISQTTPAGEWSYGGRRLDANSNQVVNYTGLGGGQGDAAVRTGVWDYANSDLYAYSGGVLANSSTSFQTDGSTSDTDSLACSIGANTDGSSPWVGLLGEILVWPRPLTTSERRYIERGIATKWGQPFV